MPKLIRALALGILAAGTVQLCPAQSFQDNRVVVTPRTDIRRSDARIRRTQGTIGTLNFNSLDRMSLIRRNASITRAHSDAARQESQQAIAAANAPLLRPEPSPTPKPDPAVAAALAPMGLTEFALGPDTPINIYRAIKLQEVTQPRYATVYAAPDPDVNVTLTTPTNAIELEPSMLVFATKDPLVTTGLASSNGVFTGMATVQDTTAVLQSGNRRYLLRPAPTAPIYSSYPGTKADLKSGANVFVTRKAAPNGRLGEIESINILPEGELPEWADQDDDGALDPARRVMVEGKNEIPTPAKEAAPTSGARIQ